MLDVQRNRAAILREEVHFTRRILIAHLLTGLGVLALLAGHGVFFWALGAGLWYMLTIPPLLGMGAGNTYCRHLLGLLFLIFSVTGVMFLTHVVPNLNPNDEGLISTRGLPFWLGSLNLLYAVAGFCLMMHRKVRKAVTIGFSLW
jgi:hypothetical protein